MISILEYSKVHNKICVFYNGKSIEILKSIIKEVANAQIIYPKIQLCLACKDELYYLLDENSEIIKESDLKRLKNEFSYIKEIKNLEKL